MKKIIITTLLFALAFFGLATARAHEQDAGGAAVQGLSGETHDQESGTTPADQAGYSRDFQNEMGVPTSFGERSRNFREEIAQKLQQKREEISIKMNEKREQIEKLLAGKRSEMENLREDLGKKITYKLQEKIAARFDAMIGRLANLATRIQSRIDKIEAAGGDVASAQANLEKAKDAIAMAKAKASSITLDDATDLESISRSTAEIADIKDTFVDAQNYLSLAVRDMKSANEKIKEAGSNTNSLETHN